MLTLYTKWLLYHAVVVCSYQVLPEVWMEGHQIPDESKKIQPVSY